MSGVLFEALVRTICDEAKKYVSSVIQQGDDAVDATMGNGWDTLFLAEAVGEVGMVYGFDVQEAAVVATTKRLKRAGVFGRCQLYQKGHETMEEIVPKQLAAVMFNLGYLPYANKAITTKMDTTLRALRVAVERIRSGGLVTMVCYRGHAGGQQEAASVLEMARALSSEFKVHQPTELPEGDSPVLVVIERC